jgi:mRNA-degrading endonuclease RelE of RelBE toxin-antitoxin system
MAQFMLGLLPRAQLATIGPDDNGRKPIAGGTIAFSIEFTPDARNHIRSFRKRDQQILIDAVADQLTNQPDQPTTNRKPLEANPIAPWGLRVGDFRVFYDINGDDQVAVGHKTHNRLRIGDEEIDL